MAPLASFLLSLSLMLALGGCTTFRSYDHASKQSSALHQQGDQMLRELQQSPQRPHFRLHHEPWVSKKALALPVERLPSGYNRDITFATGTPMPLTEFSKLISKLCGLPVRVTPDAAAKLQGKIGDNPVPTTDARISDIRWQGSLAGLLDAVSASLGLSWKYSHSGISLHYLDSRTFQIYAIPSETKMSANVKSGVDTGGGTNSASGKGSLQSSQSTDVSLKSSMVHDIHRNIKSMLTPNVGQMSIATSTGSMTVTDTPEVLDRIGCYLQHENHTITKQVLLNIKLLSVELTDSDQMSINWDLISKRLGSGKTLLGAVGLATTHHSDPDSSTVKIIGGGQWDGAQFLLKALAQQGKVSVVTSPSVTTLNLQPVPVQVATQISYVAQTKVTKSRNELTTSLTPGMITYGFNMNLLPFVMADNQLLLQYAINLSELVDLKTFGNVGKLGGSQIQLPEINTRIFSQKVKLKSGETLVLSGFEQARNSTQRQGAGKAGNWLLGGGIKAAQRRDIIVLMITPVLLG